MSKWRIGDVTVTKIVELEVTGGSRFILPQATREAIQPIAWLSPLWHGVEMCRSWVSGTHMTALAAVGHTAYLLVYVVVGALLMRRVLAKRLFA